MAQLDDGDRARIAAHRDELVNQELLRRARTLAEQSEAEERNKRKVVRWVLGALGLLIVLLPVLNWIYKSLPTPRAASPACRIDAYGIFTQPKDDPTRGSPDPVARKRRGSDIRLQEATNLIGARLGLVFGVIHRFDGIPKGELIEWTVRHPPLPTPSGATTTSTRMERPPNLARSDFVFRQPQEMVAGEWVFEFRHKGVLLCQQQFRVVTPANT